MKITVDTADEALELAFTLIQDAEYDLESSRNAGYSVYRSKSNPSKWISRLGDRDEINIDGMSINIWIEKRYTKKEVMEMIEEERNTAKAKRLLTDAFLEMPECQFKDLVREMMAQ